jgi:ribonuclease HI
LADFVAESSAPTTLPKFEVDDRWLVYVDRVASYKGSEIGVTMIVSQGEAVNYAMQLLFMASNNIAEYEALLVGLSFAKSVGARRVVVYSDSQLAVNQISGIYEAKDRKIKKYLEELQRIYAEFDKVEILHIPRTQTRKPMPYPS